MAGVHSTVWILAMRAQLMIRAVSKTRSLWLPAQPQVSQVARRKRKQGHDMYLGHLLFCCELGVVPDQHVADGIVLLGKQRVKQLQA